MLGQGGRTSAPQHKIREKPTQCKSWSVSRACSGPMPSLAVCSAKPFMHCFPHFRSCEQHKEMKSVLHWGSTWCLQTHRTVNSFVMARFSLPPSSVYRWIPFDLSYLEILSCYRVSSGQSSAKMGYFWSSVYPEFFDQYFCFTLQISAISSEQHSEQCYWRYFFRFCLDSLVVPDFRAQQIIRRIVSVWSVLELIRA